MQLLKGLKKASNMVLSSQQNGIQQKKMKREIPMCDMQSKFLLKKLRKDYKNSSNSDGPSPLKNHLGNVHNP